MHDGRRDDFHVRARSEEEWPPETLFDIREREWALQLRERIGTAFLVALFMVIGTLVASTLVTLGLLVTQAAGWDGTF